jgi:hypothetical protein
VVAGFVVVGFAVVGFAVAGFAARAHGCKAQRITVKAATYRNMQGLRKLNRFDLRESRRFTQF